MSNTTTPTAKKKSRKAAPKAAKPRPIVVEYGTTPPRDYLVTIFDGLPARKLKEHLRSRDLKIPKGKPEMVTRLADHCFEREAFATLKIA